MEEALRAYLLAQSGVSSLITDRAYWSMRPQAGALPALVLAVVSPAPSYAMDGYSGLTQTRVQIDCFGVTYAQAKGLARTVRNLLNGKRFTQSSIRFEAFRNGERDLSEAGTTEGARVHRISLDFQIWHQE
jgi:hypothetical protein